MKEFKIKTSKHKNKYTFTKLFMVIGLVFITSNTFIYNASAQAVVSNVYAEKENDSVVMKRELVNLSKDEKPLYLVVFEKPLKLGSKGSKVKYMQNILQGKGYLNTSTGVYD